MTMSRNILRSLKSTLQQSRRIVGRVERLEGRRITGWVLDRAQPDTPLALRLEMDGTEIARRLANLSRPDVAASGLARDTCGFEFELPAGLPDGQAHRFVVRLPNGRALRGAPLDMPARLRPDGATAPAAFAASGLLGMVERIGPTEVTGWILDPADADRAVDLCLKVDGRVLLSVSAELDRRDVAAAGHARLSSGFRIQLPDILFDGAPHLIQIVENETGAVLPGGEQRFSGQSEGVAFLRAESAALAGWLRPGGSISVQFDDAAPILAKVDAPVPGLGVDQGGFEVPIPAPLLDGNWHKAIVRHPATGRPLDGSPISFRLSATGRPVLRNARMIGRRFQATVTDAMGQPLHLRFGIEVDGQPLPPVTSNGTRVSAMSGERRAQNVLSFAIPPEARQLVLRNDEDGGKILGRWSVAQNRLWPADEATRIEDEISGRTLDDPGLLAGAREAFDRLLRGEADDEWFDLLWYGLTWHGRTDMTRAEAVAAYAEGARTGQSPSAFFDEQGARRLYPAVAALVDKGELPCVFALYLHLGGGLSLNPLGALDLQPLMMRTGASGVPVQPLATLRDTGLSGDQGPILATAPAVFEAPLPPLSAKRTAAECVFSAWMSRLAIEPALRDTLGRDEEAARDVIRRTRLQTRPLISIIMPTFNRAHTIGDAIQSVLDQTYDNFELLVCDDASEDKTAEVIKQFDDPRVRYMQFAKSNGAGTRNKGLRFARGEIITYLDSDNLWNPHFLDVMLRSLLARPGVSLVYCAYLDTEMVGARVKLAAISRPPFNPIGLSSKNFMDLNTIMHRRHVYDWLGGFDATLPRLQDWDLMLRYTSVFRPDFVDHCLVYYRRNVAWGQVTHLFQNSGAQNFVNRKTQARLEQAHVELPIDWSTRHKLRVLAPVGGGPALLAQSFADLAHRFVDIDMPTPPPADVPDALSRFGFAAALQGDTDTTLCIGYSTEALRALGEALPAADILALDIEDGGIVMRDLRRPERAWHLGTLPLPSLAGMQRGAPVVTILPGPEDRHRPTSIGAAAREHGLTFMIPPEGLAEGDWVVLHATGQAERLSFDRGLQMSLAQSRVVACVPALEQLTPGEFALVAHFQGCGVPAALSPSPLGDQWLSSRCAYPLAGVTPDWIAEKLAKLLRAPEHARLSAAALTAWQITHHPELTQERLAVALHAILHASSATEITHV
ncbi:glycosyltransferase family 2 protein [Falsirhodobacter sp. 1013]|uniref:glycosyltransferase family 2 protein n=1 Tax=Falsirhodobacter sp. 1013 TaxID=3417566 RepID=UPI003EBF0B4F